MFYWNLLLSKTLWIIASEYVQMARSGQGWTGPSLETVYVSMQMFSP